MTADRTLTDADVEAIVARLADELRGEPAPAQLVDATALAATLGVSREWVYEHADQLGARRLGDGDKPRLRFDVEQARKALPTASAAESGQQSQPRDTAGEAGSRHRRSSRSGTGPALLPIRGGQRAV